MISFTLIAAAALSLAAQDAAPAEANRVVAYSTDKVAVFSEDGSLIGFKPLAELPPAPFEVIKHESKDLWGVKDGETTLWLAPMQLTLEQTKTARAVQCTTIASGPTSQSTEHAVNATMGSGEACAPEEGDSQ